MTHRVRLPNEKQSNCLKDGEENGHDNEHVRNPFEKILLCEESLLVDPIIQWVDKSCLERGENKGSTTVSTYDNSTSQSDIVREPLLQKIETNQREILTL